jgi:RNA polymerase sigma-70 factor (ECF subfamily)
MSAKSDPSAVDRSVLAWLASEAALGGDTALHELLRRLQRPLLGYAARLLANPTDAQDAWQETALAISRGIVRLRDTRMVRGWAFGIARNKAADILRSRDRRRETPLDETQPAPDTGPARLLDADSLLARLSPSDRSIVLLFYLHGLSLAEIGEALDLSPGAARVRLFRARARLKDFFEGDNP